MELRLKEIVMRKINLDRQISEILGTLQSLELSNTLDELSHRSQDLLGQVQTEREKLEVFQNIWRSYISIQSTIQPWLGAAEDQIENEGSVDLAYSELMA